MSPHPLDANGERALLAAAQSGDEDATFSMPPQPTWFGGEGGPEEMAAFMAAGPLSGEWRWKHVLTTANGQPALAFYSWYEPE